jgi:hypothetical protein
MGTSGAKTQGHLVDVNHKPLPKLQALPTGRPFTLPYILPLVSYKVRPEHRADAAGLAAAIKKADPAVQILEVAPPITLVQSWPDTAASCPSTISVAARRPAVSLSTLTSLPATSRILAVLDSGVPENDNRFHLWTNRHPGITGHLIDDVHGYDFVNQKGFPADDLTDSRYYYHGTHVAGIATQRLDPAAVPEIDKRLDLMVLKVANADGDIVPQAVDSAIWYASDAGVRVANLSFDNAFAYSIMRDIQNAKGILFVVAAGNAHDHLGPWNVDVAKIYPARYTKDATNVLAVAAADDVPAIACFSNFGPLTIDVAAPGVAINSTSTNGGTARMDGTSQAAPLVAYVAALLSTTLESPAAIKARILDTVDVVDGLKGKIVSEGVVNGEKALLLHTDLVQTLDGTIVTGNITNLDTLHVTPAKTISVADIRKIVPHYSSDPAHAFRLTTDIAGKRETTITALPLTEIVIVTSAGPRHIGIEQIKDIVPRARPTL